MEGIRQKFRDSRRSMVHLPEVVEMKKSMKLKIQDRLYNRNRINTSKKKACGSIVRGMCIVQIILVFSP